MHKGSRMRAHLHLCEAPNAVWPLANIGIRATFHGTSVRSYLKYNWMNGLNRAISCASLVDRSKRYSRDSYVNDVRARRPLRPGARRRDWKVSDSMASLIEKKGEKNARTETHSCAHTRTRQRLAWVYNVNQYAQKEEERKREKQDGAGGEREADLF